MNGLLLLFGVLGHLTFGIPGKVDVLVEREGYAAGYVHKHRQAAWVIYKLTADQVKSKPVQRKNQFKIDPDIPDGPRPEEYRGSSYDRGHLAPAADVAFSGKNMAEKYTPANMSL